jgi:quercetin dioxygenase-like cupin family protein
MSLDMRTLACTLLAAAFSSAHLPAWAHDDHAATVVPQREYTGAADILDGPGESRGVASVRTLGSIDLGSEFAAMEGREFRLREIVIESGGVIAIHRHDRRPGFAYILEGEIVEVRNDHPQPLLRGPGDVATERTGITHWWENRSGAPVRALVADIVPLED